jgi:tRNA-splicing ligase RtcB
MTAPGFIVKGKGENASLNSASHGAGRKMSRTLAIKSVTQKILHEELEKHNVKLMGGGLDEAPQAYKDIEVVMQAQKQLVDVAGKFYPKIVKMDSGSSKPWQDKKRISGE